MSATRDDGGPAFPEAGLAGLPNQEFIYPRPGMSLRDYFAAHCPLPLNDSLSWKQEAAMRYEYADAMLRERAK